MLYYDEYGNKEKPTILLLHGAGALDTFCGQYCFSDKYHLVVPHLAGAGKAAGEIYEPQKTVEELFTLIRTLHKKQIGIIGHSLGGQIAIMLVSKQPELFNFAVFLSAWVNPKPKKFRCTVLLQDYRQKCCIGDGWCNFKESIGTTQRNKLIIWQNIQNRLLRWCITLSFPIH